MQELLAPSSLLPLINDVTFLYDSKTNTVLRIQESLPNSTQRLELPPGTWHHLSSHVIIVEAYWASDGYTFEQISVRRYFL